MRLSACLCMCLYNLYVSACISVFGCVPVCVCACQSLCVQGPKYVCVSVSGYLDCLAVSLHFTYPNCFI